MRIGQFSLTPELLREVLKLPLGTEIVDIRLAENVFDRIDVTVTHPHLPEIHDKTQPPTILRPEWLRQEPVLFLGWNAEKPNE